MFKVANNEKNFNIIRIVVSKIKGLEIDKFKDTFDNEKYSTKKKRNKILIEYLEELKKYDNHCDYDNKIINIDNCCNHLIFAADEKLEKRKLYQAEFCKDRFCSICVKNKSVKTAIALNAIMQWIKKEHDKEFIFLTLTAPNVPGYELKEEIDKYNKGFEKLIKRKRVKNIIFGYVRKLEITYNKQRKDYHPHFHILIAVNKSYFKSRDYIKQEEWLKMWREIMKDPSIKEVDVRKVKPKNKTSNEAVEADACFEISKYEVKDVDYLESFNTFQTFFKILRGRKTLSYGGLFKKGRTYFKQQKLNDYLEFDDTEWKWLLMYGWNSSNYELDEIKEITPSELERLKKRMKQDIAETME